MGQLQRIKAALIGSGAISKNYLTNISKNFSIIELVGCSDIISERSAKRAEEFNIRQMTNEEILNDDEIKIVINTTYPTSHYEVSKAALEAGKHVYTEKMIAVTLEEGKELLELAKSKNLLYTTAPDTFLGGGWQTVRHIIDSGFIGEPIIATGVCIRAYHDRGEKLTFPPSFVFLPGGGIPFDMGGYYLHNFINLFGTINRVTGFIKTRNPQRIYENPRHEKYMEEKTIDTPNTMVGSLEFETGVYASLTVTSESALFQKPVFEVIGSEGTLTCFDPNDFSGEIILSKQNSEPRQMPFLNGYINECRGIGVADMAFSIKNNRRPRAHCDMGYHAFEVVHGLLESSSTGQVYKMQSTCPRPKAIRPIQMNGTAQEFVLDD